MPLDFSERYRQRHSSFQVEISLIGIALSKINRRRTDFVTGLFITNFKPSVAIKVFLDKSTSRTLCTHFCDDLCDDFRFLIFRANVEIRWGILVNHDAEFFITSCEFLYAIIIRDKFHREKNNGRCQKRVTNNRRNDAPKVSVLFRLTVGMLLCNQVMISME